MRGGAFLAALFGVIIGLLFGMLLWGGATQQAARSSDDKVEGEIRDALRDIRTLLERQPVGTHVLVGADASAAAPAAAQPEPLTTPASARSADELRTALDEAIAALHRVAAEGGAGGFADAPVSPDAAATLSSQLDRGGKGKPLDLFGCSPREVHEKLGRPTDTLAKPGEVDWDYNPSWPNQGRTLRVTFADGYVVSQVIFGGQ